MKKIKKNRLYSFSHNGEKGILKLVWTDETANMRDQDFKDCLLEFAALAKEHKTPNLWVDSRKFKHQFGPGVLDWRAKNIIPAYQDAGVTKEAFEVGLGGRKMPPKVTDTGQHTESFETADEIFAWFSKK